MAGNRKTRAVKLPSLESLETPRGEVVVGTEFTVQGEGRHRASRLRACGEINAWPIKADGNARDSGGMRTFKPDAIHRIHRERKVAL